MMSTPTPNADVLVLENVSELSLNMLAGDDTVTLEATATAISVEGSTGNDTFYNRSAYNLLQGGDGDDLFVSNGAAYWNAYQGGAGADRFRLAGVEELSYGGAGDDRFLISNNSHKVYGEAGNDFILASGVDHDLLGGAGNDTIVANGVKPTVPTFAALYGVANHLEGGEGDDILTVNTGMGEVYGCVGNDQIKTGSNGEVFEVLAGAGDDTVATRLILGGQVRGEAGNDTIRVTLTDSPFTDRFAAVLGDEGDDVIQVTGTDTQNAWISGGRGADSISVRGSNARLVDEDVNPTAANDVLRAVGNSNYLQSNLGNDELIASGQNTWFDLQGIALLNGSRPDTLTTLRSYSGQVATARSSKLTLGGDLDQVAFFRQGHDLWVSHSEGKALVKNQFLNQTQGVSEVTLGGLSITAQEIATVVAQVSSYAAQNGLALTSVEDVRQQSALMSLIANSW